MIQRRGFLAGLAAALAAPAIIRTPGLLMPVKRVLVPNGAGAPFMANGLVARVTITTGSGASATSYATWVVYSDHIDHRLPGRSFQNLTERREMLA